MISVLCQQVIQHNPVNMKIFEIVNVCRVSLLLSITCFIFLVQSNGLQAGYVTSEHSQESSYYFYQQSEYPRDCKEVHDQCSSINSSQVHYVRPEGYPEVFEVLCDTGGDSQGWTVIQRRNFNGSISFRRDWDSYKQGFGFLSREFWIGNEKLSYLTSQKRYQLLIEMTASDGSSFNVTYNNFRISDEGSGYTLVSLDQYSGNADHITWCPNNLYFGDCTCGKKTCEDPGRCLDTCTVGVPDYCVPCPEGFYMKGENCVPQRECGCYIEEDRTVIEEGGIHLGPDCASKLSCSRSKITMDKFSCSPNTVCHQGQSDMRRCECKYGYVGRGESCISPESVRDCQDLYNAGIRENGVYSINPKNWPYLPFDVYCNMTDGGGWTVFQRRIDGTEDFYNDWATYKKGFGNLTNEFWLGNDKLYHLTNQREYQIRIDLVNRDGAPYYAKFTSFRISNEEDNYRLTIVDDYSGTADDQSTPDGDALTYHRGYQFSTNDRDNDANSGNCAVDRNGAWWYKSCYHSNLNGDYHGPRDNYRSIYWNYLPGPNYNIKYTEMKIRPV